MNKYFEKYRKLNKEYILENLNNKGNIYISLILY